VSAYDAFLLVSFGGPSSRDEVMPFLENVTRGRSIPRERLVEVAQHYYALGGKSPINDRCRELIAALETAFLDAGIDLPIYWGNRNWHPMLGDTFASMEARDVRRVLAFTTSAFSSYSGCRQYLENLEEVALGTKISVDKIRQYWNHPGFIDAVTDRAFNAFDRVPESRRATTTILFTAHSIPVAMASTSPYEDELMEASRLVASRLELPFRLVYQSRSGSPTVPWLEPDVVDVLRELEGVSDVVVVPIGFTSDHVEVVWDLDREAHAVATELGLGFHRAATVGTHPAFIEAIVDMVVERTNESETRWVVGARSACPDVCPRTCCAYIPGRPPTR